MRRRLFVAAVLLHATVLVGWAASLEWELARAPRIRLEVAQRDPRDLLRGDFILLHYRISEVPLAMLAGPPGRPDPGDRIYVVLAPKGGAHDTVAAYRAAPTLAAGQRVIVGRLMFVRGDRAVLRYGIERYYVPEGKGTAPRGQLEAEVALTDAGRPFLTRLFVDGRPYP